MGFFWPSRRMNRVGAARSSYFDQCEVKDERSSGDENAGLIEQRKAAAWAWYGRGGGGAGNADSQHAVVTAPAGAARASTSRFRMEAFEALEESGKLQIVVDNRRSNLLDAYELNSFSRRLEEALLGGGAGAKLERSSSLSGAFGKKGNSRIMRLCGKLSAAFQVRKNRNQEHPWSCGEKIKLL
ncbi:uncharacterized protein LOC112346139 [Selaginella moellendorffii]|uniref:uncharacterized protein LOC112346139 n=1 Tax=Selaginella moellendorffii TaxID=88036 RepID=UPI000D1C6C28|nr:uncharacterized protein LOC112346139 [Selaginella moellendorffii]|eukprot:XP_024530134.1 uncharacterized protein LOC112346139 [Selaginella moellendorffii]